MTARLGALAVLLTLSLAACSDAVDDATVTDPLDERITALEDSTASAADLEAVQADLEAVQADLEAVQADADAIADSTLRTKADVYTVVEMATTVVGYTNVSASCDDEDDVLLSGGCKTFSTEGLFYDSYPSGVEEEDQVAAWNCGLSSTDDRGLATSAYVVCFTVDG